MESSPNYVAETVARDDHRRETIKGNMDRTHRISDVDDNPPPCPHRSTDFLFSLDKYEYQIQKFLPPGTQSAKRMQISDYDTTEYDDDDDHDEVSGKKGGDKRERASQRCRSKFAPGTI